MPTLAAFIAEPARQRGLPPRDGIREMAYGVVADAPTISLQPDDLLTAVADLDLALHAFGPRRARPEFRSDLQRPNG